jgi:hypothetical protein
MLSAIRSGEKVLRGWITPMKTSAISAESERLFEVSKCFVSDIAGPEGSNPGEGKGWRGVGGEGIVQTIPFTRGSAT